jgi:hypothetical protein
MQRVYEIKYNNTVIGTSSKFEDTNMNSKELIEEVDGIIAKHAEENGVEFENVANSPYQKLIKQA